MFSHQFALANAYSKYKIIHHLCT